MASSKTVTHPSASTAVVSTAVSAPSVVSVTPVKFTERVWVSTNPSVSIYPWLGQVLTLGQTTNVTLQPGQTLYSYTTQPAQLSVTIN